MRRIGSFETYPVSRYPRLPTFNHSCTLHEVDQLLKELAETLVRVGFGRLRNAIFWPKIKVETICCVLL